MVDSIIISENFSTLSLDIAIGVFSGLFVFLLSLLFVNYLFAPKMRFSDKIKDTWLKSSKRPSYSIRIQKVGWTDLIETGVVCRLAVKDVLKNGSDLWNFYNIPTTFSYSLTMKNSSRIVHLKLHEAKVFDYESLPHFKRSLKIGRPEIGLRFADFFMSYDDVYIQIFVLGHDRFPGVKKVYESKRYNFFELRDGTWDDLNLKVDFASAHA